MNFENNKEIIGLGDSERCIEIPWGLSKYSDEQTVLDIGYANAEERYIKSLLSLKIPYLHGLDISKREIEGIISHLGDIRKTNFDDNFFDFVFCISTLEHIGRDNSIYRADCIEDEDQGDLDAIREIYRITKNEGKIVITLPFGKLFNFGWFIHYDENRLNTLLNACPFEILKEEFFIYKNGWHKCDINDVKDVLYHDNEAPAAAGLVCLLLKKISDTQISIQKVKNNNNYKDMTDNLPEIQNDEINVEAVMGKIRENIHRRKSAGESLPDPDTLTAHLSFVGSNSDFNRSTLHDLTYINSNWDIHNNSYFISSHHPYLGKMLVKGRQIVHGEVRRYVDPVISRQAGFNASAARIINQTTQKCSDLEEQSANLRRQCANLEEHCANLEKHCVNLELSSEGHTQKLKELEDSFFSGQRILDQKISRCIEMVDTAIEGKIDERIQDHLSQMNENIHEMAWLAHILENRIRKELGQKNSGLPIPSAELNYYLFEERFRGSRESIKQQQLAFLPFFENCSTVLDIGCGRGEFLEILRDHNIGSIGIDIDPDMIQFSRSRKLNVELIDAITYLEKIADNSIDGIFIDQVVEHLEPDYLVRMLSACFQKMKPGGNIIVETVNPLSLASFFNFYLDMSHHKPVHPLTLHFLLESVGFRRNEIKYYSEIPEEVKLQKIHSNEKISDTEQKILNTYNSNIEQLNNLLWGPRDYAIIGRK
jgi:SAM-dependent methyltransferase